MHPLWYKQLESLTPLRSLHMMLWLVNYYDTSAEKFKEVIIILMIIAN